MGVGESVPTPGVRSDGTGGLGCWVPGVHTAETEDGSG